MATARTALEGLLAQVTPGGGWGSTLAGIGWPGQQLIQSVAQGASLVAVFDAGDGAKNATRWAGTTIGINDALPAAPGLLATVSSTALQPSGWSISVIRACTRRPACWAVPIRLLARATASSSLAMKAPEPVFTSITSASSPAASFFDRIEAVIRGMDSTVAVTSRIA